MPSGHFLQGRVTEEHSSPRVEEPMLEPALHPVLAVFSQTNFCLCQFPSLPHGDGKAPASRVATQIPESILARCLAHLMLNKWQI